MGKRWLVSGFVAATMIIAACTGFTGCNPDEKEPENLTDAPLEGEILADFSEGGPGKNIYETDGFTNGQNFNVWWSKDCVSYSDGAMSFAIKENPGGSAQTNDEYKAGAVRSYQFFGYGDYEVRMKAVKKVGVVSTFFTYTGPSVIGEDGQPEPHDEIDVEILGYDTTKVQFNYFVDGYSDGHKFVYDLGFDASEDFHDYGFRWTEDYIVWFVDGVPVHKVYSTEKDPVPSAPGRIQANYWCGTGNEGWMGKFTGVDDQTCDYRWIKTSAVGKGDLPDNPSEGDEEKFDGDWNAIDALDAEFTTKSDKYTIKNENGATNITYTDVQGGSYVNAFADVNKSASGADWVHFVLKNNSSESATVRVNVVDSEKNNLNLYGYGNGTLLKTATGTTLELAANEEMAVEIRFSGVASLLELMLDSSVNDGKTHSGDITLSDLKFSPPAETPEEPDEPEEGEKVAIKDINFSGNLDLYTVSKDEAADTATITYDNVSGASYKSLKADVSSVAAEYNAFRVTIKNGGTEAVKLRIDIDGDSVDGATACNVSATIDGVAAGAPNPGSKFEIAAGKTVVIEIVYDSARNPGQVRFFIDSADGGDTATHAGNIVLSEIIFKNVQAA